MRERKSARLLVINPARSVLLFRFVHKEGPLAGDDYWATPGGGVEPGETYEEAAIRELREETGIQVNAVGSCLAERNFPMRLPCGEMVISAEQYFVVHAPSETLSSAEWTAQETRVIADAHWWSADALRTTTSLVWPENLVAMLERAGVFEAPILDPCTQ